MTFLDKLSYLVLIPLKVN